MNWNHFLLWLAGIYGLYYLAVLLLDLTAGNRKDSSSGAAPELTFSEDVAPIQMKSEAKSESKKQITSQNSTEVIGSGGVPITDLFRLAKQEAIIYTRSVSF